MGDEYAIATWPWVKLLGIYGAWDLVEFDRFRNVGPWLERAMSRPASKAARRIPDRNG